MLPWEIGQILGTKNLEIVADQASCVLWVNDIVDKTTLCSYHGIGKTRNVFIRVFLHILFGLGVERESGC